MKSTDEKARKTIIARRAQFLTIALAGAGLCASQGCDPPRPWLSSTAPEHTSAPADAGAEQPTEGVDAGVIERPDDGAGAGREAESTVCLSVEMPPDPP